VRSPPDGYNRQLRSSRHPRRNGAIYKLGYDLVTDLEPVVLLRAIDDRGQQERGSGQIVAELLAG